MSKWRIKYRVCHACKGTGLAEAGLVKRDGSWQDDCPVCRGEGEVEYRTRREDLWVEFLQAHGEHVVLS